MINTIRHAQSSESTRDRILNAAFDEMHMHGFQGMRVEQVLASTGLAKGALYHYFANKQALGYAVVDELLSLHTTTTWHEPLLSSVDPITTLQQILHSLCSLHGDEGIAHGCPLNNLSQEMSGLDDGFHERLTAIYCDWTTSIAAALARGQKDNTVRRDIDSDDVALFLVSSTQGILGAAKCMQSTDALRRLVGTLSDYLENLRASDTASCPH
jgi:AcrR family transcriptional regulator